jgi:hypothetical protein
MHCQAAKYKVVGAVSSHARKQAGKLLQVQGIQVLLGLLGLPLPLKAFEPSLHFRS